MWHAVGNSASLPLSQGHQKLLWALFQDAGFLKAPEERRASGQAGGSKGQVFDTLEKCNQVRGWCPVPSPHSLTTGWLL